MTARVTEIRLQEATKYVRKTFFPRWDMRREWTIKRVYDLPSHGLCDSRPKNISLQFISENDDDLHKLLIHEICHAVTNSGHKKTWQNRMLSAADTAKKIGREHLSKILYEEVRGYDPNTCLHVNAGVVYGTIQDFVFDALDSPSSTIEFPSYDQIIKTVARTFGFSSQEIEESWKRCKEVYEKAVEDAERNFQLAKQFEQRKKQDQEPDKKA